jgi:hypothetical protein
MTDADTGSLSKETGIRNTLKRYLGPDGVIMILLVLLSIVGIGITDFSPLLSHWYWLAMVVVIGIACIVMDWSRARKKGLNATTIVKKRCLYGSAFWSRSTWCTSFFTRGASTVRTLGWSSS